MIATGELNLVQGTYRAFGQDLQIRAGQVGFSGTIDNVPPLHLMNQKYRHCILLEYPV